MVIAILALIGLIVALYLWIWKLGLMGPLVCGTGECEVVQSSPWAVILGLPVAFYGVVGYLALLVVSLVGLQPKWADRREPTALLVVLSVIGFAFTVYLTYLEAAVIRAWCRWCLVSAGIMTAIFVTSLVGLRGTREKRHNGITA